jgi:hypothetical protein
MSKEKEIQVFEMATIPDAFNLLSELLPEGAKLVYVTEITQERTEYSLVAKNLRTRQTLIRSEFQGRNILATMAIRKIVSGEIERLLSPPAVRGNFKPS